MASTVGTVEVIASINTSKYEDGAKKIESTNQEIEKGASKSFKGMETSAQVGMAGVIAAVGLMANSFVNSASEIQSLRASFESLTGNVDDTNAVMTSLYNLGKKTAFDNKDIQAAGRNYLAAGVAVEDLEKVLSRTADIAGATGADLGQLTLPLTQTIARGKLQTQDFYQILNSGAGALRKPLTELAGKKGFGSLAEAMEKGAISSDDLLTVMGQVTKQGGFAFQGAVKQSETFAGRMSNLQESITNVGLSMLGVNAITGTIDPQGVFAKLSTAVSTATTFLSENGEMMKQIAIVAGILLTPAIISLGTSALIAGANMVKAWLMALGPIGLIAAAVTALAALIIMNWDAVSKFLGEVWSNVSQWAIDAWNTIARTFQGVGGWFSGVFNGAAAAVRNAFSGITSFFSGVWTSIVNIFGSIGTAIGNAIGGAVKGVVNSILGFAENTINGFIRAINNALNAINKIPGVNIGRLGLLNIPRLAEGGIVPASPGGILANIGEGGEAEAVIPLSKLDKMIKGDTTNTDNSKIEINVSGVFATSKQEQRNVAELIANRLQEVQKSRALGGGAI